MPAERIEGYPWLIRSDPRRPPFAGGGPRFAWAIGDPEPGVHNPPRPTAFLVLTATPEPPALEPGWEAEPARLDSDFDAAGVRLIHVLGERATDRGPVQQALFEVAG